MLFSCGFEFENLVIEIHYCPVNFYAAKTQINKISQSVVPSAYSLKSLPMHQEVMNIPAKTVNYFFTATVIISIYLRQTSVFTINDGRNLLPFTCCSKIRANRAI
jgi:hypothetical protein